MGLGLDAWETHRLLRLADADGSGSLDVVRVRVCAHVRVPESARESARATEGESENTRVQREGERGRGREREREDVEHGGAEGGVCVCGGGVHEKNGQMASGVARKRRGRLASGLGKDKTSRVGKDKTSRVGKNKTCYMRAHASICWHGAKRLAGMRQDTSAPLATCLTRGGREQAEFARRFAERQEGGDKRQNAARVQAALFARKAQRQGFSDARALFSQFAGYSDAMSRSDHRLLCRSLDLPEVGASNQKGKGCSRRSMRARVFRVGHYGDSL